MKAINLTFAVFAALLVFAVLAFAADGDLRGAHKDNGLTCADCHGTDKPDKRASQNACKDCHGDKSDDTEIRSFKDADGEIHKSAIHTSHVSPLRCTLCHQIHKPSVLYCNQGCHHSFEIKVP